MTVRRWLQKNTASLAGKRVAVTGSTGGLGRALCRHLAGLGAELVLLDRNPARSAAFREELLGWYPGLTVFCLPLELEDIRSVEAVAATLEQAPPDVLILNAGAYAIPRYLCSTGYENVFQINCLSPYYLVARLLPALRRNGSRVVAVGSIAHRYSTTSREDVDFRTRRQASLAYGNSKRRLMYGLYGLFRGETEATLSVVHPGITFTNITAHYPKVIFALIRHPMKVLFMAPSKAALSILRGVFQPCGEGEWIGPRLWDIWGFPKKRRLRSVQSEEAAAIQAELQAMYHTLVGGLPEENKEGTVL